MAQFDATTKAQPNGYHYGQDCWKRRVHDKCNNLFFSRVPRVFNINEVPDYLRFNPYIRSGYRNHKLTFWQSLSSLFYIHNETVNILSHGIPFVYFLFLMPHHMPWNKIKHPILAFSHIAGSVAPWLGSCVYHTFMSHQSGVKLYNQLLKWDVIGIWVTQSFGASTTIYTSLILYPRVLRYLFVLTYTLVAIKVLQQTLQANCVWQRRLGFGTLVALRIVAFFLRISAIPPGQASPLIHIVMQELMPITGAIISAARIPECYYPGYFDLILNSHNILHVTVVLGAIHMHLATCYDLVWLSKVEN